ncbi:L,D-transpeptidase catalytic domain [Caloramator quimbayensis]|uniref:L,D-transpeptidase catalytic domain n=1 Tax=Caloramator quimbayensis TaxID=1147123 RepID=A0A1T4WRB7_9CLOT|nr:peptidoglycan-binding protein [Caloramator quimbayensis]SKA79415.1 L,D-transpeptidase catalytic domain [Caloramator quimbayensis]
MRRVILLFVIISMCIIVAIAGTFTFLESDSVLKQKKSIEVLKPLKNNSLLIDERTGKLYLINEGKIIKSYAIKACKSASPLPEGNWAVALKHKYNKDNFLLINTGWGMYYIRGMNHPWNIKGYSTSGCISLKDSDMNEIYRNVEYGTEVKIIKTNNIFLKYRILNMGDKGYDVFEIQKKLKKLGFYKGEPNGIFDEKLKNAAHEFQRKNNLKVKDYIEYLFYNSLSRYIVY